MEIKIDAIGKTTVMLLVHRQFSLQYPLTKYKRKASDLSDAYKPLNEYWHTMGMSIQDAYFSLYAEALEVMRQQSTYDAVKQELTEIVRKLWEVTDYEALTYWTLNYGNVAYNKAMSDTIAEWYNKRINYTRTDYEGLVVLSMFFKMVSPIWSMFSDTPSTLETSYQNINALELCDTTGIYQLPAMHRLMDYCEALAEEHMPSLSSAIIGKYIGSNEIPKFFLAMAIVRRISVGEIRSSHDTLIKITSNYLRSIIKNLSGGVRDKQNFSGDDDGDDESVAERYWISQKVQDALMVTEEAAIKNLNVSVKHVNPEGNVNKAAAYVKAVSLNPRFSISAYHLILVTLACERISPPSSFMLLTRDGRLHLIGIAAAYYSDTGKQDIANMMLASHSSTNFVDDEVSVVSGFAFSPLSKEEKQQLDDLYPYKIADQGGKTKGNFGTNMIEYMLEEINSYTWDENVQIPTDLRRSLVQLLVEREEKLCRTREALS